ncbi:MAG: carboxymuconolactone decarboxylase family protein [Pseudomonadota bacterium]
MSSPAPRIAPVTGHADVPSEHHATIDAVVESFGAVLGPFSMLLHSPELGKRVLNLGWFFRDESIVEPRLRSFAILAAARELDALYVWAAQAAAARVNGLSEAEIDLLRAGGAVSAFPAEERVIVLYTRQLIRKNRIDQPLFDALLKARGAKWLVELTAAATFFVFLSGIVNAFEVPARAGGDPLPVPRA